MPLAGFRLHGISNDFDMLQPRQLVSLMSHEVQLLKLSTWEPRVIRTFQVAQDIAHCREPLSRHGMGKKWWVWMVEAVFIGTEVVGLWAESAKLKGGEHQQAISH